MPRRLRLLLLSGLLLARLGASPAQAPTPAASTTGQPAGLRSLYDPLPDETHATIYHPATLRTFRRLFAPAAAPK